MNYKKYLSGVLAAAMVLNTGAVSVLAAGTDTSVQEASQTQTSTRDFQQQHRQSRRAAMCLEAPDGTAKVLHWMRACRERRSALILTVFT